MLLINKSIQFLTNSFFADLQYCKKQCIKGELETILNIFLINIDQVGGN